MLRNRESTKQGSKIIDIANNSDLDSGHVQPTTCEVCDDVVSTRFAHTHPSRTRNLPHSFYVAAQILCNSVVCRQIASTLIFSSPHLYQSRVEAHRKAKQAQRKEMAKEERRMALLREKMDAQNKAAQSLAKSQLPQLSSTPHLICIPTGLTKLVKLPSERAEKYRARLSGLIDKASEYSNAQEVSDDEENQAREKEIHAEYIFEEDSKLKLISDQLCETCKGGCCAGGEDHGYLQISTLRRFMDDNPTLSPDQVLGIYMEKLAAETAEDSCINQTNRGCGLPRNMRSHTCNSYYCQEIRGFHDEVVDPDYKVTSATDVIAVQRGYIHWDRQCENACHKVTSAFVLQSENITKLDISNLE